IVVLSFRLSEKVRTQKDDGSKSIAADNRRRVREVVTAAVIETQYYGLRREGRTCTESFQGSGKRNDPIVVPRQPLHLSRKLLRVDDVRGWRDSPDGPDRVVHQHPEAVRSRRPKSHKPGKYSALLHPQNLFRGDPAARS